MGELRFGDPVPYGSQPYLPKPPPLPEAGKHLVYLDVWNREVTHLEQPDLVESAVGVETTSRVQTVWQVKVLPNRAGSDVSCGTPDAELEDWANLIAPSTGRLTTGTYEVAAVPDPCELPPTGGFRGLENQLYRVEIHKPGPAGTATFKWSRENASVGSRVATIVTPTKLELQTLGRDQVLCFNSGDWVEILDDVREFSLEPGEIRKIEVDEDTRQISFTDALPPDMLPTAPDSDFPRARNLRVRRWDQRAKILSTAGNGATSVYQDLDLAGQSGLIKVPDDGTTLLLENGVTVKFTAEGTKGFRAGDYWVFAARTSDASVEHLSQAAPRGVHHHYARLAVWEAGTQNEPADCRHRWPPRGGDDCGCTQCVSPASHKDGSLTLQEAVRRVQEKGGTVCLQPGEYVLDAPVRITNARSVRIKGQGPGTLLVAPLGAFNIESGFALAVENLSILSLGRKPAINIQSGAGIALHNLVILVPNNPDFQAAAIALSGAVAGLTIRDNLIVAPRGIRALDPSAENPLKLLITAALRIEGNVLWCERQAVDLAGNVGHLLATRIVGNELLGCRTAGIALRGFALPGASMRIENNSLNVNGPGIQCAVDGAWVSGNKITGVAQGDRQVTGSGISLLTGLDSSGSDQCQLLANQVSGFPDAGILIDAPVQELICKLNIIENCGNGIVMVNANGAGSVSIENNHLRDIGTRRAAPTLGNFIYGIRVIRADTANVAGNTMRRIGVEAVGGIASVAGIAHFAIQRSRVTGNTITEVGPARPPSGLNPAGILLQAPYAYNEVTGNHVERDGGAAAADGAEWSAVTAQEAHALEPIVNVGNFSAVAFTAARMLVLDGIRAFAVDAAVDLDVNGVAAPRGSSAVLRGNVLLARGNGPCVSVRTGMDVTFADNRCELNGGGINAAINSGAVIVNSNMLRGGKVSLALSPPIERVTVLGNIVTADISVKDGTLAGSPWQPLNVKL
jgi:predicted outer membrane repeat protein